jgi:hypothetical protein
VRGLLILAPVEGINAAVGVRGYGGQEILGDTCRCQERKGSINTSLKSRLFYQNSNIENQEHKSTRLNEHVNTKFPIHSWQKLRRNQIQPRILDTKYLKFACTQWKLLFDTNFSFVFFLNIIFCLEFVRFSLSEKGFSINRSNKEGNSRVKKAVSMKFTGYIIF